MRWAIPLAGLALAATVTAGCQQRVFVSEADYGHYRSLGLPPCLELRPDASAAPLTPADSPPPATVDDPDRQPRFITLSEALAIALEQGHVGTQSPLSPGLPSLPTAAFTGGGVTSSDNIRVLSLDPARVGSAIELALSKFDARWITSLTYNTTDVPVATALQVAQAGGELLPFIHTQDAVFNTTLLKPLPTGGVAGITFRTDYEFTNLPNPVNPAYRPALQFQFEQPLLLGYGVEMNQLRATHPNSLLTPFSIPAASEGILITRLRFDQQRAELQRNVNQMLLNVEAAYWNLYGAYWGLFSRDQGLRFAYEAWRGEEARFRAGRTSAADLAYARGQYELFRSQRLAALGTVLEAERRLRSLLNIPRPDGTRLVPADAPTLAPYRPSWDLALHDALNLRPELVLAREELKAQQLNVRLARNALLPDLRFTSTYDVNALGSRLDGPGENNALRNLFRDSFNNWTLGLRLEVPLGYRAAHATLRAARLSLARSYQTVLDQEDKVVSFLELQYRQLAELHAQVRVLRAEREAFARQLELRFREFAAGRDTDLNLLLQAQRFWADALTNEYSFVAQYNTALATFEFAKGTILSYHNVSIAEGPLPGCARGRAVEHQRQRTRALVLRERAWPVAQPAVDLGKGDPGLPLLPPEGAPSLPALLEGQPPPPDGTPDHSAPK